MSALTAALDAEYAAVYLYGLIGGRASRDGAKDEIARINAAYQVHVNRRDELLTFVGSNAPAPAVAYVPPIDPVTPASRTACAREIESRLEAVYTQMIAATTGTQRQFAVSTLTDVSKAAVALGQTPTAFPGLKL